VDMNVSTAKPEPADSVTNTQTFTPIGAKKRRGRPRHPTLEPARLKAMNLTRRSIQRFRRILRLFDNDPRLDPYFMSGRDSRTFHAMEQVALLPEPHRERCLQAILGGKHPRESYDYLVACLLLEGKIDDEGRFIA
jgi:hypothetical protein